MATNKPFQSNRLLHPGEVLAEELEARSMTQKQLADTMGRPLQVINGIIRGRKALTAETALGLEAALRIDAEVWMNLQKTYELDLARREYAQKIAASEG